MENNEQNSNADDLSESADLDNTTSVDEDSQEEGFDSRKIYKATVKKLGIIGLVGICIIAVGMNAFKSKKSKENPISTSQTMDLDAGSMAADTDKMWRKNLEDQQSDLDKNLKAKIETIQKEINHKVTENDKKEAQEIRYLKEKLNFIQAELDVRNNDNNDLSIGAAVERIPRITRHVVNLKDSKNDKEYVPLKTADNYIPAGTMIEAATLNGLRASTSVQSMSNPDEILIQLIDYGILPNNFRNNLKDCVIVADAYGDLSSETVKIRTSKLSCIEIESGESIETDLVGMVVGGDGYAGIKGTIVSIDQKYLANASIFGIMSGIAGVGVKDSASYNPFTIGTGATTAMSDSDRVQNNLLQGTSSSLDKLSDYYIAHAERIQPVIEIDRGRSVTVAVLKGAYIGTSALKKNASKRKDIELKRAANESEHNLINSMEIK
ncbi:MAG: TraB/VirB10 family protein [Rickettsiales bacterium]|jgi:hypothetical protein|nr:TraB/VirB10 family protein [Rickettsiales bacterium]